MNNEAIDIRKLRKDMTDLWVETFNDSPEYVKMIFDAYFDPALCAWRYDGRGRLKCALMGVPYVFGSVFGRLKGLYLCGLSTRKEFRGEGLMSELIEEINHRAERMNFSFTFLIPADEGLERYYADRGYSPAMRLVTDRYTVGHDFSHDYRNWVNKSEPLLRADRLDRFDNLKWVVFDTFEGIEKNAYGDKKEIDSYVQEVSFSSSNIEDLKEDIMVNNLYPNDDIIDAEIQDTDESRLVLFSKENNTSEEGTVSTIPISELYGFVNHLETSGKILNLVHSKTDFILVVKDWVSEGGKIFVVFDEDKKISSVGFVRRFPERVEVRRLYGMDIASRMRLLSGVTRTWPTLPVEISLFPSEVDRVGVTEMFYGGSFSQAPLTPTVDVVDKVESIAYINARIYGMVRILRFSDFLIFLSESRSDAKFSIFMKRHGSDKISKFFKESGRMRVEEIPDESIREGMTNPDVRMPVILSDHQLQSLLLRKGEAGDGGEDSVTLAFGLPPLVMNMALLLD